MSCLDDWFEASIKPMLLRGVLGLPNLNLQNLSDEQATGLWATKTQAQKSWRLTFVVRSNRRATIAYIAEDINAVVDRKVGELHGCFWQQKGDKHNIQKLYLCN